ncbi:MAG: class I SAM-dependent methyltransferase [Caulobacteraceae bacterium]
MNSRAAVASLLIAAAAGFAAVAAASAVPAYIAKAVADPSRPADDRKLDADRKPAAVLAFAGVRPGETVGEYLPGGGYYTRLLSDIVGPGGHVYALETTTWGQENIDATKKALAEPGRGNVSLDLAPLGAFHLPAKVDLFWITDNYHDLHVPKFANVDMAAFNKHVFESLEPGGVYFIIDHAAAAGTGATLTPKLHRIDKATVVAEVTAAGFKLAGDSDLLRNGADDHTRPVFDPALHFKTDQFILKFVRP